MSIQEDESRTIDVDVEAAHSVKEIKRCLAGGETILMSGAIVLAVESAANRIRASPQQYRYEMHNANVSLLAMLSSLAEEEVVALERYVSDWFCWEEASGLVSREAEHRVDELAAELPFDVEQVK